MYAFHFLELLAVLLMRLLGLQAIIDLLLPGKTPKIKELLVDLYGKPELLFFGPDGM